jgi:SAM-dependent methyltransferase
MYPYRRLALGAGQTGRAIIEHALAERIIAGARRMLIAGAADTGLLASVARAAAGHDVEIEVVDRCATPIELCRRFAERWSLPVAARVVDLAELDARGFDLVYANSVLPFIPAGRRSDLLTRMRQALRPGGHLLLVFNTGGRIASDTSRNYRSGQTDGAIAELDRRKIPLPDAREAFQLRTEHYVREMEAREGIFDDPNGVDAMIEAAGFTIERRDDLGIRQSAVYQDLDVQISKPHFLVIARSPAR